MVNLYTFEFYIVTNYIIVNYENRAFPVIIMTMLDVIS